jgi:hypothetical protein
VAERERMTARESESVTESGRETESVTERQRESVCVFTAAAPFDRQGGENRCV